MNSTVAKAIIAIISSLGDGPVEQGRIGNALSKEEKVTRHPHARLSHINMYTYVM